MDSGLYSIFQTMIVGGRLWALSFSSAFREGENAHPHIKWNLGIDKSGVSQSHVIKIILICSVQRMFMCESSVAMSWLDVRASYVISPYTNIFVKTISR